MEKQHTTMGEQLTAMQRQTDVMEKQFEAIIAEKTAYLSVDLAAQYFDPHAVSPVQEMNILITHYGTTNAFNVIGTGAVVVRDSEAFPDYAELYLIQGLPFVVEPGDGPFDCSLLIYPSVSEAESDSIRQEKAFLHFVGQVGYQDFMSNKLTVWFWYVWKVNFDCPADGIPVQDFSRWELRLHPELKPHKSTEAN